MVGYYYFFKTSNSSSHNMVPSSGQSGNLYDRAQWKRKWKNKRLKEQLRGCMVIHLTDIEVWKKKKSKSENISSRSPSRVLPKALPILM